MKTRILLSTVLLVVLLSGLFLPAMAQGPDVDVAEPAPEKAAPEGKGLPEYPGLPHQAGIAGVGTDYAWSQTLGTYTEIAGGTLHGSGAIDDNVYNTINIGFTFTYNNVAYTQLGINTNGFVRFGGTAFSGSCSYTPISSTDVTNCKNLVAALGEDLQGNTAAELRSELLGTSPNQVFVIQWKDFKHYGSTGTGTATTSRSGYTRPAT